MNYKDYVGNYFKGKRVHFSCDCVISLSITGVVVDYEKRAVEIIYVVRDDNTGKLVRIGENTPKLKVEIL